MWLTLPLSICFFLNEGAERHCTASNNRIIKQNIVYSISVCCLQIAFSEFLSAKLGTLNCLPCAQDGSIYAQPRLATQLERRTVAYYYCRHVIASGQNNVTKSRVLDPNQFVTEKHILPHLERSSAWLPLELG